MNLYEHFEHITQQLTPLKLERPEHERIKIKVEKFDDEEEVDKIPISNEQSEINEDAVEMPKFKPVFKEPENPEFKRLQQNVAPIKFKIPARKKLFEGNALAKTDVPKEIIKIDLTQEEATSNEEDVAEKTYEETVPPNKISRKYYCNTYHTASSRHLCNLQHIIQRQTARDSSKNSIEMPVKSMALPKVGDEITLKPVYIADDFMFYAHFNPNAEKDLKIMHEDIRQNMDSIQPIKEQPYVGQIVLCEFTPQSKVYFRAKVLAIKQNRCKVFLVDYGVPSIVGFDQMARMPLRYLKLVFQAVLCQLWNLQMVEGKEQKLMDEMCTKILNKELIAIVV